MEKAVQPLRFVSREYQIYCSSGSSSYTNSRTQHGGEDTYTGKVIESNCISTGNAVTHIMDYAVRCSELNYLSWTWLNQDKQWRNTVYHLLDHETELTSLCSFIMAAQKNSKCKAQDVSINIMLQILQRKTLQLLTSHCSLRLLAGLPNLNISALWEEWLCISIF